MAFLFRENRRHVTDRQTDRRTDGVHQTGCIFTRPPIVRIDGQFSQWITLAGGMPPGSLIGLLTFILLIDDLVFIVSLTNMWMIPHSQNYYHAGLPTV